MSSGRFPNAAAMVSSIRRETLQRKERETADGVTPISRASETSVMPDLRRRAFRSSGCGAVFFWYTC